MSESNPTQHNREKVKSLPGNENFTRFTAYAGPRAMQAFENSVAEGLSLKESVDAAVAAYSAADAEYESGVKAHLHSKDERDRVLAEAITNLRQILTTEEYVKVRDTLMYKKPLPSDISA